MALTVTASLVGWFSFDRVGAVQSRVNEGSVPEMEAAFGVAQYSSFLVAAGPQLTSAQTPGDLASVAMNVDDAHRAFHAQMATLEERIPEDERVQRIEARAETLILNVEEIEASMSDLFVLADSRDALRENLTEVNAQLEAIVVSAVDDQFFYTITGFRDLGEPQANPEDYFSEREVSLYRHLAELQADATIAAQVLASAFSLSDAHLVEPLRERFEAAIGRIDQNLSAIQGSPTRRQLLPILNRLSALGTGEESGFDVLASEITLRDRQQDLLANNRGIGVDLIGDVDSLVSTADANVQDATRASTRAILTGRALLLGISTFSIGGALVISWLYVGRILLRRLQLLSTRMRDMAGGDLEAEVQITGRDEVADMAAALEVFRRHALEVQRLNLVERLAEELQGKNEELESVLADLRRAQDQIVVREKLAALGELTAGVAHEIRNPLNFVNNFSEVSDELLTELQEALEQGGDTLSAEQRDLIRSISNDLSRNLERIRTHGDRANRIVHDMLAMGRGSGEAESTDINGLLDEYANLAYHSARAADPEFQVTIERDFDPTVGRLEVIPQDLGRVFLNIVSNACHATTAKRAVADRSDSYSPTVSLNTRRADEHVEVRIRDNGTGIPADVIDKIFNPFFTTKPTDQGTGLGLAISSDIVRQHGGDIRVNSEPGEFTEMIVELPLVAPSMDAQPPTDRQTDK